MSKRKQSREQQQKELDELNAAAKRDYLEMALAVQKALEGVQPIKASDDQA